MCNLFQSFKSQGADDIHDSGTGKSSPKLLASASSVVRKIGWEEIIGQEKAKEVIWEVIVGQHLYPRKYKRELLPPALLLFGVCDMFSTLLGFCLRTFMYVEISQVFYIAATWNCKNNTCARSSSTVWRWFMFRFNKPW